MSTISILNFASGEEIRRPFPVSRILFILLLLLGTPNQVLADKVDDYVKAEMEKNRIPGLALAVVKDGRIVKAKGYGLADVELNVPATPDTVFQIASITKPFTALATMMLVEEGKVGLDEKIGNYLTNAPNSWSNITVRHLLTHTAGVVGGGGGPQTNANQGRWSVKTSPRYEALRTRPLAFRPGERSQYSGTGYFLLGVIIENISGQSYRDFLPARVFGPAGMTSTSISDADKIVKNGAGSYAMHEGELIRAWRDTQVELPADSGILSSVKDLAKWAMALYSQKLVKRSTLEQMWTPGRLNDGSLNEGQGLGWGVGDYRGHRTIGHGGSSGAEFLSFPDDKLTVIMLCNLPFDDWYEPYSLYRDIGEGVAGQYDRSLLPPPLITPQPDPHPETTERLLSFLSDIASGKDSSLVTPGLQRRLIAAAEEIKSLRDYARSAKIDLPYLTKMVPLSAQLKDRKAFTFLACDKVANRGIQQLGVLVDRICYFKMVTQKKTFYYTFWLTADGQIADFDPKE